MRNHRSGLPALFLCIVFMVSACRREASQPPTPSTNRPDGPSAPRHGGALKVALQSEGKTLDPHKATDAASMRLIENLYSTLVRYAKEYGEVEPDLAERYDTSEDGRVYTFQLRAGARFHASGREVTAGDVKYSIERIRENEVRAEQFAAVAGIETPASHTVVIRLSEPVAPFLTYLACPMNAVVDREIATKHDGSLDGADAGSGPFRLLEWKRDQHLIMKRHAGYHLDGKPYLDRVIFRPIPDETARTTALRNGEIDLVLDVPAKDVTILEKLSGVAVQTVPGTFWEYVGLNTTRAPFDRKEIRQAVAWAIDRHMINRLVKFGRATVLDGGHIPPGHWAHADLHLYPKRDLTKARALLQKAGVTGPIEVTLKVGSSFPYQVQAAQIVKQQLKEIGINVTLRALESSVFFDDLARKDFQMTLVGWVGFVDPDEWTYNLFHTGAKWNQQGYSNPEVDQRLEHGRRALSRSERMKTYTAIQRIVAEDAPMVFLYANEQTSAYRDDVRGFEVHPTATTLCLRDTWLDREE